MNRFVIAEPTKCIGCNTCLAACSMVHKAAGLQAEPRLTMVRTSGMTAPAVCRHCEDAPCKRVCPVEAITQVDGAVYINETLCVGCKLCAIACPFGSITPAGTQCAGVVPVSTQYQAPKAGIAETENATDSALTLDPLLVWLPGVKTVAVKCDLCSFRAEGAECVRVCPTKALSVVDNRQLADDAAAKRIAAAAALDALSLKEQ